MQLCASDLMRRSFDTILEDASVEEAIHKIFFARVRPTGHKTVSLMVVDRDNGLVGTISMYYILFHLRPSYLNFGVDAGELDWDDDLNELVEEIKHKEVREIMNRELFSVPPDEPLMSVLDRMIKKRLRRISVVEHGQLVGVVYMSDIFYRLFAE